MRKGSPKEEVDELLTEGPMMINGNDPRRLVASVPAIPITAVQKMAESIRMQSFDIHIPLGEACTYLPAAMLCSIWVAAIVSARAIQLCNRRT